MDFALTSRAVEMRLIAGRAHYEVVIEEVLRAECSVWIATANLKELMVESPRGRRGRFHSILDELDALAARRVELRMLHASYPTRPFREAFDKHPRLVEGGMDLRLCPRVHFKAVIIDGRFLYVGSANWTGAGLGVRKAERRNFEMGIVTEDELLLDQVQETYDRIWRGRACRDCSMRDQCEAPLDLS